MADYKLFYDNKKYWINKEIKQTNNTKRFKLFFLYKNIDRSRSNGLEFDVKRDTYSLNFKYKNYRNIKISNSFNVINVFSEKEVHKHTIKSYLELDDFNEIFNIWYRNIKLENLDIT